jgi:hypothetical protein
MLCVLGIWLDLAMTQRMLSLSPPLSPFFSYSFAHFLHHRVLRAKRMLHSGSVKVASAGLFLRRYGHSFGKPDRVSARSLFSGWLVLVGCLIHFC